MLTLEPTTELMNTPDTPDNCETQLAQLLQDLTQVQDELLDVLSKKRQLMANGDRQGMLDLQPQEEQLCERLQQCHDRRASLLQDAQQRGLPSESLGDLASVLKQRGKGDLRREVKNATSRMGLLQHNCLANWVLAQKALLHASQMLEIIATGGRLQPTYDNRTGHTVSGALVDQEV
jgi:hypothetical protein